jgi:hypothetical protein
MSIGKPIYFDIIIPARTTDEKKPLCQRHGIVALNVKWVDMSEFRITYDGPALTTHQMDVRELAPALLAAGDLLDAAVFSLNGNSIKAQTNVVGSFKTGCFAIDFALSADWLLKVRDIFAGESATAIANATAILGLIGLSYHKGKPTVISALKWLKGRKILKVDQLETTAIIYVDDDLIEVETAVLQLLTDIMVRQALDNMLSPLDKEGIETFAAGTDSEIIEVITKEERAYFQTPAIEDILLIDEVRKMVFSIVSLAFKDDNKWRLYDGAATIHAVISAKEFLNRVDQNLETFAKGDVLICMVNVKQWQTQSGAKTEYDVIEVLEHRSAARQMRIEGFE